jgi:AcrR family transcriptional regulator
VGVKERKVREKVNLRQAILDAAQELFVKDSFANASMRKIAEKIEYSPTTIYLYFKDKRDIFNNLMEDYFSRLKKAMKEVGDINDDLLTRMKKEMKIYITFGLENPNYYRLAFMSTPDIASDKFLDKGQTGTEIFQNLRATITECVNQGLFKPMNIDLIQQIIWSMNHGITSLIISTPDFPWFDREILIQQSIDCTIDAFIVYN